MVFHVVRVTRKFLICEMISENESLEEACVIKQRNYVTKVLLMLKITYICFRYDVWLAVWTKTFTSIISSTFFAMLEDCFIDCSPNKGLSDVMLGLEPLSILF